MVVYMHTFYNFSIRQDFYFTKLWWLLEPFTILAKTCIPLFFMLSGYLNLTKPKSIEQNWQKTKQRIILPLLFFETINIAYRAYLFDFSKLSIGEFSISQLNRLTSHPSSPLWFLYVLAILYALNPIWWRLFQDTSAKQFTFNFVKISFLWASMLTFLAYPTGRQDVVLNAFTSWTGFVWAYLYGGLIAHSFVKTHAMPSIKLILLGFAATLIGDGLTGHTLIRNLPFIWQNYTGNFLSLPIMILSVGIFGLLLKIKSDQLSSVGNKAIIWLASLSFGIYLFHTYVVSFLTDILSFNFDQINMNLYLYIITNFTLVITASIILTLFFKKITPLKKFIGE